MPAFSCSTSRRSLRFSCYIPTMKSIIFALLFTIAIAAQVGLAAVDSEDTSAMVPSGLPTALLTVAPSKYKKSRKPTKAARTAFPTYPTDTFPEISDNLHVTPIAIYPVK